MRMSLSLAAIATTPRCTRRPTLLAGVIIAGTSAGTASSFHRISLPLLVPHNLTLHSARNFLPQPTAALSSPNSISPEDDEGEDDEQASYGEQVREAIVEIVQEAGASREESVHIASNSPKYAKMLRDSVRELDELSLWTSWMKVRRHLIIEGEEIPQRLSFQRKVRYLAKEKDDNGKIPFLESIGLNLSSATHIASFLSSETLPSLIHKVKYVKKIFFSGSDDGKFIGKTARLMMLHLSISVDEDVQQTLSFFEKMDARRGGLEMLGLEDASFRHLIESFPHLLLLSMESCMKPMVEFLEEVEVPGQCIGNILLLFPPIVFRDIEKDIKPGIVAFEKVAMGKDFGRMLYKYPWILSTSIQQNFEAVFASLEAYKVPKASIHRAIRSFPLLLGCSNSKFSFMIEKFNELGIKGTKLGKVVSSSPQLLLRKPHDFSEVVMFMQDLGLDRGSVGRILGRCPEMFAASIDNTLRKKVKFLSSVGIWKDQLPRVIKKYPELLVSDVDRTLLPRLNYLMEAGLSKRDVVSMITRFSPLLGYSIEEVLRPKLEFLVYTMEKPVKDLVEYPRYFSYSLEKKIKPRFMVLKGRNITCSLKDMLGKNDEEFAAEFMGIGRILVPR